MNNETKNVSINVDASGTTPRATPRVTPKASFKASQVPTRREPGVVKIVMTGGGSPGHVTPNLALATYMKQSANYDLRYIGSYKGVERHLLAPYVKSGTFSTYTPIFSGKLRRYFSIQNFFDVFFVCVGFIQALVSLVINRPHVVFSKGGFVSLPVVYASYILRIPIVAHESDMDLGLTSRLTLPLARKFCFSFNHAYSSVQLPDHRKAWTGTPLAKDFYSTASEKKLRRASINKTYGLNDEKPHLLVFGGGLGAQRINNVIIEQLPTLVENFQILHVCGKGNTSKNNWPSGYVQIEYSDKFWELLDWADFSISRSGANAVYELMTKQIPTLFIPLPKLASRGEQITNASYIKDAGMGLVLEESGLKENHLIDTLNLLQNQKDAFKQAMRSFFNKNSAEEIETIIADPDINCL